MVAIATLSEFASSAADQRPTSEAKREYLRQWRQRNADKIRARRVENRDRDRARKAAWYEANKDLVAEYNRRYIAANPDTVRRVNQVYRARKRTQHVEAVDPQVLFERDQGICVLCWEAVDPSDWWIEHLIPISRGGEHSYANTGVSHPRCNQRKKNRLPSEMG